MNKYYVGLIKPTEKKVEWIESHSVLEKEELCKKFILGEEYGLKYHPSCGALVNFSCSLYGSDFFKTVSFKTFGGSLSDYDLIVEESIKFQKGKRPNILASLINTRDISGNSFSGDGKRLDIVFGNVICTPANVCLAGVTEQDKEKIDAFVSNLLACLKARGINICGFI